MLSGKMEGILTRVVCGRSVMIIAGCCEYNLDTSLRNNGVGHGITIWRFLDDYPHYKQVCMYMICWQIVSSGHTQGSFLWPIRFINLKMDISEVGLDFTPYL